MELPLCEARGFLRDYKDQKFFMDINTPVGDEAASRSQQYLQEKQDPELTPASQLKHKSIKNIEPVNLKY